MPGGKESLNKALQGLLREKADKTEATQSAAGLMSAADKKKLDANVVTLDGAQDITGAKTFLTHRVNNDSDGLTITYENVASLNGSNNTTTGVVCITLPAVTCIFDMDLKISAYNTVCDINIRGYVAPNSGLYAPAATGVFAGIAPPEIRYANDSNGNNCILIGNVNTVWANNIQVTIPRVTVGFGRNHGDFSDIKISILTDETGYTTTFIDSFGNLAGTEKRNLIWENENPTSEFNAQNFKKIATEYTHIEFICVWQTSSAAVLPSLKLKRGEFGIVFAAASNASRRTCGFYDDGSISIDNCTVHPYAGALYQDNAMIIPMRIYGIKEVS